MINFSSKSADWQHIIEQASCSFQTCPDSMTLAGHHSFFVQRGAESNPLFKAYPNLAKRLSYISLARLPSPLIRLKKLEQQSNCATLVMKHDGSQLQSAEQNKKRCTNIGANKIRKLEYLLADALAHECSSVITFGCAGSNHVVQTALSASELGLTCWGMLLDQPNSYLVRRALLLHQKYNTSLRFFHSPSDRIIGTVKLVQELIDREKIAPYIIPTGGSSPRGTLGYVQAVYELLEQIKQGDAPIPDILYLPVGSAGLAAGILLGLQSAGIPTHVYCVLTEPDTHDGRLAKKIKELFIQTMQLLISYDSTFPICKLTPNNYTIISDCAGDEYGLFTQNGQLAQAALYQTEGILLDGIYSAKCFAALLRDLRSGVHGTKNILFWNTFCAEPFQDILATITCEKLPKELQRYFIDAVQPLDA